MRRVFQRVVVLRPLATLNFTNLFADGDHGVDEAVQLVQRFALCGLHHQCAWHREAQRGGVKAVIHQALGNVFCADAVGAAAGFLQRAQVQNAFMRDVAVFTGIKRGVMVAQLGADVVGAQDGDLGGLLQTVRTHHAAIHPADGQHCCIAQGGC